MTEKESEMVLEILAECKDMVSNWGAYAGDYFSKKHDLAGDIKQIDDWIAEIKFNTETTIYCVPERKN